MRKCEDVKRRCGWRRKGESWCHVDLRSWLCFVFVLLVGCFAFDVSNSNLHEQSVGTLVVPTGDKEKTKKNFFEFLPTDAARSRVYPLLQVTGFGGRLSSSY